MEGPWRGLPFWEAVKMRKVLNFILFALSVSQVDALYAQERVKLSSSTLYVNTQLHQYPADRGVFNVDHIQKAYSFRIGAEGNVLSIAKNLYLTLGVYYTKDYSRSYFKDSTFVVGKQLAVPIEGTSTEDYNFIETPVGIEHQFKATKNISFFSTISLLPSWSINSRDIINYQEGPYLGTAYSPTVYAKPPIPNSLRVMVGLGVLYKFREGTSLLFQPNYIHGLENVVGLPFSIYYISNKLGGSYQFLNVRVGIRKEW